MSKTAFTLVGLIILLAFTSCGGKSDSAAKDTGLINQEDLEEVVEAIEVRYDWDAIANKIFFNENNDMDKEGIVEWMNQENHLSAGIGHMIWYPFGVEKKYEESFPQFIKYAQKNAPDIKIPEWLTLEFCPFDSKSEFEEEKDKRNGFIEELADFLFENTDVQVKFLFDDFKNKVSDIVANTRNPLLSREIINNLLQTEQGAYALVDYNTFKGDGLNPSERFDGEGWGLLQVIDSMSGMTSDDFANAAVAVLSRRVVNQPEASVWIKGWTNRIDTYRE